MPNLIGQTIKNRYRIDKFLGRGGMADVYKVWDQRRATFLAMKLLHEDLALDRVFINRFKREGQTLSRLQHPNIVRFYGLEQDQRLAFMLLDYIEGDTLKHAIFDEDGPLKAGKIRKVLRAVCSALQFAHSEGLVHCDIKPANIMINQHGTVLLSDFGISRLTDAATATMVGAGTPAYMSPEQVKGLDPVPQTDIYALGIVLFEMLTGGQRPFTGDSAGTTGTTSARVRWEQLNLDSPEPSQFNPEVNPGLDQVVIRSLAKKPEERYPTVLDFLNAVEKALGEEITPAGEFSQQGSLLDDSREQDIDDRAGRQIDLSGIFNRQKTPLLIGLGLAVVVVSYVLFGRDNHALTRPFDNNAVDVGVDATTDLTADLEESPTAESDYDADQPATIVAAVLAPTEEIKLTIETYFSELTEGDYISAWSMLTDHFKSKNNPSGFGDYQDWWDKFYLVDVTSVKVTRLDQDTAEIKIRLDYYPHTGEEIKNQVMGLKLVYITGENIWRIDDSIE